MALAILATLVWSGNFIAARGVIRQLSPVNLAFYRWLTASVVIFPFAIKSFTREWNISKRSLPYLFFVALTGVSLFNTLVYIGAHYTTAINLALIGTTSSPIFAVILSRIYLKEKIGDLKMIGLGLCILGVLFLLCKGDFHNLLSFRFTAGDGWVLLAALSFATYTTLVRRKPAGISSINFLFMAFTGGTLLLSPFYGWELYHSDPVDWNIKLILIILYLGIGASVISFLCWNMAVSKLGAGRTALFGNLIPVFSSIEAAVILHEQFTWIHIISMMLVFAGIVLANWRKTG